MGGTFNPIHIGHLIAAEESMKEFELDRVLFIPNRTPPHRMGEPGIINCEDRFTMVNLAIASNPNFFASRIELDREEISYTLETIRELQELYPETEINFISGLDSLVDYHWFGLDELLNLLTRFIAVTRPGFFKEELETRLKELNLTHGNKVRVLEIPDVHISSTLIRQRLKDGGTIKYLVTSEVESFIYKNHLYI
jgi:nicotinate-nucleotide adenylyltransferase